MSNIIIYRHWQPGDDDAVLSFLPNTNEDWFRHKFDDLDDSLEPEGIRLAFLGERCVGHAMGESTSLFIEEKIQKFGTVSAVFVAPGMRRQGIATTLMLEMHTYFKKKGYRGSILETDSKVARQLYLNVGYEQVTKELWMQLLPERNTSPLRWRNTHLEDLSVLHQLDKVSVRQNFHVWWDPRDMSVDYSNMNDYRVLHRSQEIIGYTIWSQPSELFPNGSICDPVAPSEEPIEVIKSIQAVIRAPLTWQTCENSRYEEPLRSLGFSLEPRKCVAMLFPFGRGIDLTKHIYFWQ